MIIRHHIDLQARLYVATVRLDTASAQPITPVEQTKLNQLGPLVVARGGVITPDTGAAVTLDASNVYLPADFPVVQSFSVDDYANAESLAVAWKDAMLSRIQDALWALMAQTTLVSEGTTTLTDVEP